jgi:hypothetical protein
MRTRRQDRAAAAAAAAAAEENQSSTAVSTVSHSGAEDVEDAKDAQTFPTALTISQIEQSSVSRLESTRRSKLPTPMQFPLVAILSLAISALGYSLSWPFTKGVLSTHARLLGAWTEVGAIMAWRLYVPLVPSIHCLDLSSLELASLLALHAN